MRFLSAVRKMAGVPGRYVGPVRLATALAEWKGLPPSLIRLVTICWAFSETQAEFGDAYPGKCVRVVLC